MQNGNKAVIFNITVLVAALGYFVDIYDLLLFGIIRIPSLKDMGLTPEQITTDGESILSWQMFGLMLGGVFWGIVGDKNGRSSVLFGSILLYSLGNIANGFVQTVEQYKWIRLVSGIGLAGELGAGITLVAELLPKEKRGIGTSLVAGFGITGAVAAFFIKENFHWRTCYFIGGGLGLALLLLRLSVLESGMFKRMKEKAVSRGNIGMLIFDFNRLVRYVQSILIGVPTWLVIGILVTFSKEFGKAFDIAEEIDPGKSIMYAYTGLAVGDVSIGFVSQWLKSRKKALYIFYSITAVCMILYFTVQWEGNAAVMYLLCAALGFGSGFWAIFVTIGAEQFGTNLRATAATTIPNMVRGTVPLMLILFQYMRSIPGVGYVYGGIFTCLIVFVLCIIAVVASKETFHKDLNFEEK